MNDLSSQVATQIGNPILRKKLHAVDIAEISTTRVQECIATMRQVNAEMDGVGISANQVGCDLRISLIHVKKTKSRPDIQETAEKVMINPEIVGLPPASKYMWEGCLSVAHAGLFVPVMRHKRVKVKYINLDGVEVVEMLDGLEAHVVQHEVDHLNGVIFLDKDIDRANFMSTDEYVAMRKREREAKQ